MSKSDEDGSAVTAQTRLQAGDAVLVEQDGSWYEGEILSVRKNGRVKVRYGGRGTEWDELVPRSRLRLKPGVGAAPARHPPERGADPVCADPLESLLVGNVVGDRTRLRAGDDVLVEQQGAWYAAAVLEVEADGGVKVRYQGWGPRWDEVVSRQRLRTPLTGPRYVRVHLAHGRAVTGRYVELNPCSLILARPGDEGTLVISRQWIAYCEMGDDPDEFLYNPD
jgi:hypothetical protein